MANKDKENANDQLVKIIIALVFAFVVLISVKCGTNSSQNKSNSESTSVTTISKTSKSSKSTTKSIETTPKETEAPKSTIGDTVDLNGMKITLLEYAISYQSDNTTLEAGEYFINFHIRYQNDTQDVFHLDNVAFSLYADKHKMSSASTEYGLGWLYISSIRPGMTDDGWVSFKAPADWKKLELFATAWFSLFETHDGSFVIER